SYQAMRNIMRHLVEFHHYRKIAFIQGPQDHHDSTQHYRAYRDALLEYGLPFDPNLISLPGLWDQERIPGDIHYLLDEKHAEFEAIVVLSDNLAIRTITELRKRGFRIPEQIAVIGFNNELKGSVCDPPLTTASIKIEERAALAVQALLDLIAGKEVPNTITLPSNLIVRRSCGCTSAAVQQACLAPEDWGTHSAPSPKTNITTRCQKILTQLLPILNNNTNADAQYLQQLLEAFMVEITTQTSPSFISRLERILLTVYTGEGFSEWQEIISTMRRQIAPSLDRDQQIKAENLWYQAVVTLREISERSMLYRQLDGAARNWDIHRFTQRLNSTFDFPQLVEMITERLKNLGFVTFYLSLYENSQQNRKRARLILAHNSDGRIDLGDEGLLYDLPELLPRELLDRTERFSLILLPLFYETNHIGFILLERTPFFMNGIIYTSLQIQLSSALWGTLLFHKQKQVEAALVAQAQALARSNADLQKFAYVASHDLQEPLRKITLFCDRLSSFSNKLGPQENNYINRMQNAAYRMQHLIAGLLSYSRLTTKAQPFTPVDLNQIAEEVIGDLEIKISQTQGRVCLRNLPTVNADPLQMRQLFQNLISNGLKFHRENVPPLIQIAAETTAAEYILTFEDNGIGIEKSYYEKIFVLFERLYAQNVYEGSGIGLAVCKKIVEHHRGSIHIESSPGEGSKFIVKLPVT
ncbi:MAG TPA: substrate-binding domain-containing protein, partial [Bacillota bacterium]|nr:substrate-binding domain-containing protein [Bacillota bacterium]